MPQWARENKLFQDTHISLGSSLTYSEHPNPVRAGLVDCPEASEFTSVYDRIKGRQLRHRLAGATGL